MAGFTIRDRKDAEFLVKFARKGLPSNKPGDTVPDADTLTRGFICAAPEGGLPASTEDAGTVTCGSADCDVYLLDEDGVLIAVPDETQDDTTRTETVYNFGTSSIEADQLFTAIEVFGAIVALNMQGVEIYWARATTACPAAEIYDPPTVNDDLKWPVRPDPDPDTGELPDLPPGALGYAEPDPTRRMRIYTFQAEIFETQTAPTEDYNTDFDTQPPSEKGFTPASPNDGMDPSGLIRAAEQDGESEDLPNVVIKQSSTAVTVYNEDELLEVEIGQYMTIIKRPDGKFVKLRWSAIN